MSGVEGIRVLKERRNVIASAIMARIHVDMVGDAYELKITGGEDSGSAETKTARSDQLEQYLRRKGCTDAGVSNLLDQLKTSSHAEVDL